MLQLLLIALHLVGFALALGCATAKLTLLLRSGRDPARLHAFVLDSGPLTRLIQLGLVLLVVTGLTWVVQGYHLGTVLVTKLILVAAVFVAGPLIDKVFEPEFRAALPAGDQPATPRFDRARRRFVALEAVATGLFWVIFGVWSFA